MLSYQAWRRLCIEDSEIPAVSVFTVGAYKYKPRGKIPLPITNNTGETKVHGDCWYELKITPQNCYQFLLHSKIFLPQTEMSLFDTALKIF